MTTDFFAGSGRKPTDHIGRRVAGGFWCWDCSRLVRGPRCGSCGNYKQGETLASGAVGVELGLRDAWLVRPEGGISSVCEFWWRMPEKAARKVERVEDEYGNRMSTVEFFAMLDAMCPVRKDDLMGEVFA